MPFNLSFTCDCSAHAVRHRGLKSVHTNSSLQLLPPNAVSLHHCGLSMWTAVFQEYLLQRGLSMDINSFGNYPEGFPRPPLEGDPSWNIAWICPKTALSLCYEEILNPVPEVFLPHFFSDLDIQYFCSLLLSLCDGFFSFLNSFPQRGCQQSCGA